eukprot:TRINITY_DN1169_c1_g4_i3.p1 TRINITY_DN1169_c1_g4~~TRINITY_DN1169_c1_g4_i3.p1  ORF type:complete len:288 (+),score=104.00 TRINITY_DN1169_c1_g4_i3:125-988(+)
MARNEEKRNSMLSRFLQLSEPEKRAEKRPHLASLCEDLPSALKFRTQILREVGKKAFEIQNAGLGEGRIRELNDDINKLLREKYHWERRIIGLGGPDYTRVSQKFLEGDGRAIRGKGGYRYFGAAKDLPGVREKLQSEESGGSMADWEHIFRRIDMEYFGLHGEFIDEEEDDEGEGEEMSEEEDDDDDGEFHRVDRKVSQLRDAERRAEKVVIESAVEDWQEEQKQRVALQGSPSDVPDVDYSLSEFVELWKNGDLKKLVGSWSPEEVQRITLERKKMEILSRYAKA